MYLIFFVLHENLFILNHKEIYIYICDTNVIVKVGGSEMNCCLKPVCSPSFYSEKRHVEIRELSFLTHLSSRAPQPVVIHSSDLVVTDSVMALSCSSPLDRSEYSPRGAPGRFAIAGLRRIL